jgi:hypothetical protein
MIIWPTAGAFVLCAVVYFGRVGSSRPLWLYGAAERCCCRCWKFARAARENACIASRRLTLAERLLGGLLTGPMGGGARDFNQGSQ